MPFLVLQSQSWIVTLFTGTARVRPQAQRGTWQKRFISGLFLFGHSMLIRLDRLYMIYIFSDHTSFCSVGVCHIDYKHSSIYLE